MAEYIERGTAIHIIDNYGKTISKDTIAVYQAIRDIVNTICPAADVVHVIHGEWLNANVLNCSEVFECSECGYSFDHDGYQHFFNYCPNCGAKMDGGKND